MEGVQSNKPVGTFDFGSMVGVKAPVPSADDLDGRPPEVIARQMADATDAASAASVQKEEDEDDLEIGEQLDSISPSPAASANPTSADSTSDSQSPADTQSATEASGADDGPRSSEADMQNPMDPRLMAAGGKQEAMQRQAEREASAGRPGSAPGLGAVVGAGLAGTFKLVGDGLRAGYDAVSGGDPSKPKPMGILEKRATRDPNKAEKYYQNAGDGVIREKLYRDTFNGINEDFGAAVNAERSFQDSVTQFNDLLQNSPVKELADRAQTSVGDYIHAVKSGTVTDAAAKAVVSTLEQSPEFRSAEKNVLDAAGKFQSKSRDLFKKLDTVDTSFAGRLDTGLRRQQIANLADGMQNDEASKASSKIKQTMDMLDKLAESIKKAIMDMVNSVTSAFKPK